MPNWRQTGFFVCGSVLGVGGMLQALMAFLNALTANLHKIFICLNVYICVGPQIIQNDAGREPSFQEISTK